MRPFAAIFVPDELEDALSDRAWLEAMLDAERALANAGALTGVVPAAAAGAIAEQCDADNFDVAELARQGRDAGNPVEPLVRALRDRAGEHGEYVHRGATSQDVLDTAAVLVSRAARELIDRDLAKVADLCATLADEHRGTVMASRTLLQQAVPTTFGYKAAGWLVGVVEARDRLARVELPAQLGGAAGTLASVGDQGLELLHLYAAELELPEPLLPWHARRTPFLDLEAALVVAAAALGKIATDVVLMAQTEVGEVAEATGGASSTMPHKRNPTAAVLARACVRHVELRLDLHEHERAAGAWHAEWSALQTALAATGGAAAVVSRSLDGLEVNRERMRANIVAETLAEAERLGIDAARPEDYLGSVDAFIDRALGR